MKKIILISLAILGLIVANCSKESSSTIDEECIVTETTINTVEANKLKLSLDTIFNGFIEALKANNVQIPYEPELAISNTSDLIYFSGTERCGKVIAPLWETLPTDQKSSLQTWVAGSSYTAEQFFRANFNKFLVIHELGHYVQAIKKRSLTSWDSELEANKFAIAYWKQKDQQWVNNFINEIKIIKTNLPIPTNTSIAYFNQNYGSFNTEEYGYFQFNFYIMAFNSNPNLSDLLY